MKRRRLSCLLVLASPVTAPAQQNVFEDRRTTDIISQRVQAQGNLIRSQGEAWRNVQEGNLYYAKARAKLAEAVDKELDNWLKHVRVYYERREARERGRMALLDTYMQATEQHIRMRQERDERVLHTLVTDQKRSGAAIENGTALNRMLDALYQTPLSYGIELSPSMRESIGDRMDLDAELLRQLRVRGRNRGGAEMVFRLGDDAGLDLDWWPSVLRAHQFDAQRQRLEAARDRVVALSQGEQRQIDIDALDQLEQAAAELARSFFKAYPPNDRRHFTAAEFESVHRAEDFLARLDRDVRRVRDTGNARVLGTVHFDPQRDGRDMPSLVAWMLRNGLQFEAALPGDEPAYRRAFTMLRELQVLMQE